MKSLRLLVAFAAAVTCASAQMIVSLDPSTPSPAPLGTPITWTATAWNTSPGTLWYRFETRVLVPVYSGISKPGFISDSIVEVESGTFRTVRDYGPGPSFTWTTIDHEGEYEVQVSVKNKDTGETAEAQARFHFNPLARGAERAATPTSHPLVFIYSAPACPAGSRMRVEFFGPEGRVQHTPYRRCTGRSTMNFYLAGMHANTNYLAQDRVETGGGSATSSPISFTTGDIPPEIIPPSVPLTSDPVPSTDEVLLQSLLQRPSVATDLAGNVIWYGPMGVSMLTRPHSGGTFLGIYESGALDPSGQRFFEFDLLGNIVAETNAARVSEQLAALGMHGINAFHHEARKLPDGGYLVLSDSERILTDVQGPGPVDVIGDTIIVLDRNLQVRWAWDAFDHLDPHRMAVLGETCTSPANGCPPFYLSKIANDWLHGNSLQLTPSGNILYSIRHQDWIVKIDYQNGAGTGDIVWRLGANGDFQINSPDPSPWFSHQHDANLEADQMTLTIFDDGNTRVALDPSQHSRGQVLQVDQVNRIASPILNADLGTYSYALGSAQHLPNGDYHFDSGYSVDPLAGNTVAQSVEVNQQGQIVYGIQFGVPEYRTFRMPNLYTAP